MDVTSNSENSPLAKKSRTTPREQSSTSMMVVMVTTSTVQVIDFDWAGEEVGVMYPVLISSSIDWQEGHKGWSSALINHS